MAGEGIKFLWHFYLMKRWNMKDDWIAGALAEQLYEDYRKHPKNWLQVHAIHAKGFTWDDWHIDGLTGETYQNYLKTAQYYAMHPLNGVYAHWIDDKLTLKYLCGASTELNRYLPEYYFQIDQNGRVLQLPDFYKYGIPTEEPEPTAAFLRAKGELAFKRISGSLGEGFYKAVYRDGSYYLNDERYDLAGYCKRLHDLKNYLVTEYLHPHADMVPFSADTVNTIRYLVARDKAGKMQCVNTYVRFGTQRSGFVENYGAGGVLCYLSAEGTFDHGNILNDTMDGNQIVERHPDTGIALKGTIPHWAEIQLAAEQFGRYFPQMDYLGLDFVVTNKDEVKVLEVNSLTSLDALQMHGSVLEGPCGEFFEERIQR